MKKMIVAALALVMMLTFAAGALASKSFTLRVPCEALSDSQLYQHRADVFEKKTVDDKKIYVAHSVNETGAVETNRIAAYCNETKKTMGANWHRADRGLYQCMSNAIVVGRNYTVAGRGNTNYASKYGLNNITLSGYFRANK